MLTDGDLKMTFDLNENDRDHLITKDFLQTKFEVQETFPCWDIVFTRFSNFDLCWPQMTSDLHEKW